MSRCMKPSETAATGWWRWSREIELVAAGDVQGDGNLGLVHREDRMADYKEKLDEWQQAARRKARELDEKYAISDLVGEGARAGEAAKRGAETMASGAERCARKPNG
jgi:hypothetical protein